MSVLEEELGLSNGDPGLYVFDKKTLEAAIKKGMRMSVLADDGLAVEEAALEESCRALQSDVGTAPPTPPKRNAPFFVGPTRRSGAP